MKAFPIAEHVSNPRFDELVFVYSKSYIISTMRVKLRYAGNIASSLSNLV